MTAINWFEIPVSNMERAVKFYSTVLGAELQAFESMPGFLMTMLPSGGEGIGGALVAGEGYTPAQSGSLVYLNGGDDLAVALGKVVGAGGEILGEKTDIGENGFVAFFKDSEGNKIGLHSMG